MNVLFALALLCSSPSRAGVVMPVENGVAPAGTNVAAVPVVTPSGGGLGVSAFNGVAGLLGGLPLLPAPVPGLLGGAVHFVGETQSAAAVQPETGTVKTASAQDGVKTRGPADKTPAVPAKPGAGGFALAISRDHRAAAATPDDALTASGAASAPTDNVQPEKEAGLGRGFFDQSADKTLGTLSGPGDETGGAPVVAATLIQGGAFGPGGFSVQGPVGTQEPGTAFGAGHGLNLVADFEAGRGENLHDAVASVVPAGVSAPGSALSPFGTGASGAGLAASADANAAAAGSMPFAGVPRPLALDLSRSGLIVRVRSALSGVLAPAQNAADAVKLGAPGPSTALIERGAMFEAFAVAHDYADALSAGSLGGTNEARVLAARIPRVPPAPAPSTERTAPWWAWLALPLLLAALRGFF